MSLSLIHISSFDGFDGDGIQRKAVFGGALGNQLSSLLRPVSYTHLDVYKRQDEHYRGGKDGAVRHRGGGDPDGDDGDRRGQPVGEMCIRDRSSSTRHSGRFRR